MQQQAAPQIAAPSLMHVSKCNCCKLSALVCLQSLGADEVVNYREQDFAEVYQDPSKHFDAVIDCLGGKLCFILLSYHVFHASAAILCPSCPGDAEIKAYSVIKKGGAFVHIFNPGTDPSRVEEGKKWTDKR